MDRRRGWRLMKRIKLTVAYDGTGYCGWQIQPNGITVEEVLNRALSELTGESIKVIGASRTDAGVHAEGNVAVFDTESTIPPQRMACAVNCRLPEDIAVVKSEEVPGGWHPRYQASVKTYEYHILNRDMPDPVHRLTTAHISYPLNVDNMRAAAVYLKGEHDFKSFCSLHTAVKDTVRTVYDLEIEKDRDMITIRISGNGFLYNMVRIIAGTLINVGRGACSPEKVKEILDAKDRREAAGTAPAKGLILKGIRYGSTVHTYACER